MTNRQLTRNNAKRRIGDLSALLDLIVEQSADAIIGSTLDGIVTSWNPAAETIYGHETAEMIGQPISSLFPPKAKGKAADLLKTIRHLQRSEPHETLQRHKDGSILTVILTASSVHNSAGDIIGISITARDITNTSHADQALHNADKLALAGRMSASIAHEINNPLEAVTNLLFLLQHEEISVQARSYLELAQSELARVARIASQTLSFFRDASGPVPSDLSQIAESAIALHAGRLLVSRVAVETAYLPVAPLVCYPGEMRQLLANLLGNALDAITSNGRIFIRTHPATDMTSAAPGVRLTVADTGAGMTARTRRLLFEPFYTTKGSAGTGLGLWASHRIVQQHQGRITVRSSQDPAHHGTVFSIFFPFLEAASLKHPFDQHTGNTNPTSPEDESRRTHAAPDPPSVAYNAA